MVEHNLAKVGVASSSLVSRSSIYGLHELSVPGFLSFGVGDMAQCKNVMDKIIGAEWQSGYAAACKAVDLGSIPGSASSIYDYLVLFARVAELVDARDLKSLAL